VKKKKAFANWGIELDDYLCYAEPKKIVRIALRVTHNNSPG
jgi:hypothetical protein